MAMGGLGRAWAGVGGLGRAWAGVGRADSGLAVVWWGLDGVWVGHIRPHHELYDPSMTYTAPP